MNSKYELRLCLTCAFCLLTLLDLLLCVLVPDECSHELRRFIETLFITHAETKLNIIGRLTHQGAWPSSLATTFDHSNRGAWCHKLVRPSRSTGR